MKTFKCTNRACGSCIGKVPIFNPLKIQDLQDISQNIIQITIKKGETLVNEGDTNSTLYIINSGLAKVTRYNKHGKEQIISLLKDGDTIGEYFLISDYEPYNFSIVALSDMRVCTLAKKYMDEILEQHPDITKQLLFELSKKIINAENMLQSVTLSDALAKVAFVLLNLLDKFGTSKDGREMFINPLTREEMAGFANLTRETMSRYLSRLAKQGIIAIEPNNLIVILDREYLENHL